MWRSSCAQKLIVAKPDHKSKCASTAQILLFLLPACLEPQVDKVNGQACTLYRAEGAFGNLMSMDEVFVPALGEKP